LSRRTAVSSIPDPSALRVVAWGTYDLGKPRTRILLDGMRRTFDSVIEIHADVWSGVEDKSQIHGWRHRAAALIRWLLAYPGLVYRYLTAPPHDAVVVFYMGHLDVLVICPWARLRGVPVVWDVILTMYDTVVEDRRNVAADGVVARLIGLWDRLALAAADRRVMLTRARADLTAERLGTPPERFDVVPLTVEAGAFSPVDPSPPKDPERLRVLFYAQFTPMHGLDRVIAAAELAKNLPFDWRIIGRGQEGWRLEEWLERHRPDNVTWLEWVPYEDLRDEIAASDVCLGVFGDSSKAVSSAPNKLFQVLAVGRGLVTRDTLAMREILGDDSPPGIYLVADGTPEGIVVALKQAWKERDLLRAGPLHGELNARFTPEAAADAFAQVIASATVLDEPAAAAPVAS